MESKNGKSQLIINQGIDDQPRLITPAQIEIMDYLFKEAHLNREEDFKELGRLFDQ